MTASGQLCGGTLAVALHEEPSRQWNSKCSMNCVEQPLHFQLQLPPLLSSAAAVSRLNVDLHIGSEVAYTNYSRDHTNYIALL
jgi:hypothetical protein